MQNQIEQLPAPTIELTAPTPEHEIRRPGWQTSEFWIAAAAIMLPLLDSYFKTLPPDSAPAIYGGAIVAAGYVVSRGIVKKSRNDNSGKVEAARIVAATVDGVPAQAELHTGEMQTISGIVGGLATKQDIGGIVEDAAKTGTITALNQKRGAK